MNILLQEDLAIRGGAQLWLMNCGSRFAAIPGFKVTFLLREDSKIKDDCAEISGADVKTYDHEKIAENPEAFREMFTNLLKSADACVTLVRQKRGKFQNVGFMASCIVKASLKTYLIAKTGTPDPTYDRSFYGGDLLDKNQVSVITIAKYTRQFIIDNMGVDGKYITNIYNGTDTQKFRRTPALAEEAMKRYPLSKDCFAVGCIGSYVPRKGQSVLIEAAKTLVDDGRVPNIHLLFVGEGPDKEMLQKKIEDLKMKDHATMFPFTKQPLYVYERCDLVALPSVGKEGLPNVLLEALAMEKPCVSSRIYGCPEVVIDGETGYCCEPGNVKELADAIANVYMSDDKTKEKLSTAGKQLVFGEHDKQQQFEKILKFIQSKTSSDGSIYVINGFYMSMRQAYTAPGQAIFYYCCEWDSNHLSWEDFRGTFLGATDPKAAKEGSLRNTMYKQKDEFKLEDVNVGNNGFHGSASPLEGLVERLNWLETNLEDDEFAKALLESGISLETIKEWTKDPVVELDGKKVSVFDAFEDLNVSECLAKAQKIAKVTSSVSSFSKNMALLFIKPHAVNSEEMKALFEKKAGECGLKIVKKGLIKSEVIEEKKYIDNHYHSIAHKATVMKPADLNIPDEKKPAFEKLYGTSWENVLSEGLVFNAMDACSKLGIDGTKMATLWGAAKTEKRMLKFGGGFYVGKVVP